MTSRRNGRRSCQLLTYSYGRATQPLRRERPTQQSGSAFPVDVIMSVSSPTACKHTKKRPKKVTSCAEGTKCVCAPRSTCIFTPPCALSTAYSLVSSVRSPSPVPYRVQPRKRWVRAWLLRTSNRGGGEPPLCQCSLCHWRLWLWDRDYLGLM